MRCPVCGNTTRFDSDGKCLFCGHNMNPTKPRQELGKVDILKLAHGLDRQKRKREGLIIPTVSECLYCHQQSLHYDQKDDTFECVNPNCTKFLKRISFNTKEFDAIIDQFRNGGL